MDCCGKASFLMYSPSVVVMVAFKVVWVELV